MTELYNIFDYTKRNFESFRDTKFPKKKPSILEDKEYIAETKAVLIRKELAERAPEGEEYDALLEELILLHTSDDNIEGKKLDDIRERVKMIVNGEIKAIRDQEITEEKKYTADKFIQYKRTLYDEIRDRKSKE